MSTNRVPVVAVLFDFGGVITDDPFRFMIKYALASGIDPKDFARINSGVQPHRTVFLDDMQPNIDGARAVGLHAVLVEDPAVAIATVQHLVASGVEPSTGVQQTGEQYVASMTVSLAPIKVAQWGSGNVGRHAIAAVVERPGLELVGLYVNSPGKVGGDAGVLAGIAATGVHGTADIEEIIAGDADVVLHMPLPSMVFGDDIDADLDNFCRLLSGGKHVITTVGYMYPKVYGPAVVDRLDAACRAGGVAFHGTGANPGWFGDLLPLLMSGLSLRIDEIAVQEISNFQYYPSPEIMFEMMNFGRTPAEFEARSARHRTWLDWLFSEAVTMVADALDVEVDEVRSEMDTWVADRDLDTAAGMVGAGTVAAQRWQWHAMVGGRALVKQETVWRMHRAAAPDWPVGDWSIRVAGVPEMQLSLPHSWNNDVLAATAAHAINAIPYVVSAGAGIKTFLDLPVIAGRGAARQR